MRESVSQGLTSLKVAKVMGNPDLPELLRMRMRGSSFLIFGLI